MNPLHARAGAVRAGTLPQVNEPGDRRRVLDLRWQALLPTTAGGQVPTDPSQHRSQFLVSSGRCPCYRRRSHGVSVHTHRCVTVTTASCGRCRRRLLYLGIRAMQVFLGLENLHSRRWRQVGGTAPAGCGGAESAPPAIPRAAHGHADSAGPAIMGGDTVPQSLRDRQFRGKHDPTESVTP